MVQGLPGSLLRIVLMLMTRPACLEQRGRSRLVQKQSDFFGSFNRYHHVHKDLTVSQLGERKIELLSSKQLSAH
jgi:hypothetical protein